MQSKLFADPDDSPSQQGQADAAPTPASGAPAEAAGKAEYDNWELSDA